MINILKISRPRFWLYELGTFLIGVFAGISVFGDSVSVLNIFIFALFFLFPANLLIYGINDIFDYETDKLNPKKVEYETLLKPNEHNKIYFLILITNLPFLIYALFALDKETLIWFLLFFFFAIFYSAKPIRAKSKPMLDSFFSAGHYIATGIFGYLLISDFSIPWLAVLAGMLWAIAMHAYSAVPDITADLKSGIKTIATFWGIKKTIIICLLFYIISFIMGVKYLEYLSILLLIPYIILMIISYKQGTEEKIFKTYKYFPFLNALVGMIIFFAAML